MKGYDRNYILAYLQYRSKVVREARTNKLSRYSWEYFPVGHHSLYLLLTTKLNGYPLFGSLWTPFDPPIRYGFQIEAHLLAHKHMSRIWNYERWMNAVAVEDRTLIEQFEKLHWHLTSDLTEDGKPRQRSRLNVYCENERFKGFVRNHNTGYLCWGDGATFGELLLCLDGQLRRPSGQWRRDKYRHGDCRQVD